MFHDAFHPIFLYSSPTLVVPSRMLFLNFLDYDILTRGDPWQGRCCDDSHPAVSYTSQQHVPPAQPLLSISLHSQLLKRDSSLCQVCCNGCHPRPPVSLLTLFGEVRQPRRKAVVVDT